MKFQDIYALAKQHVGEGEMSSSAKLCLDDAMKCWRAGAYESAKRWARKSLSYSVGICHPDYIATNEPSTIGDLTMKTTVTKSAFIDEFRAYDRYEQFGYTALSSLFDYLEEIEDKTGEEIELDVIALCCDYSVDTVEEIAANHSIEAEEGEDLRDTVLDYLNENTIVVDEDCDGSILYCSAF